MMCLIALAWKADPTRPLLLIANRDEFHERPAAPLGFWSDAPALCAGRDLREGGTWLGVHRRGRLAAVTNVRGPLDLERRLLSRGKLTTDFLLGEDSAADHASALMARAQHYGGFNLLLWDGSDLVYASNRPQPNWSRVQPGIHGLSNAQFDTPWPKVGTATAALRQWLDDAAASTDPLFASMADRRVAPDAQLPDTGVGLETERLLSSPFIYRPGYGTRCSTWVGIAAGGEVEMRERRYDSRGEVDGESSERFVLWSAQARRSPPSTGSTAPLR